MPQKILVAVLCGGSGSRLWPLSRLDRPKQMLRLDGDVTLLETTIARCRPLGPILLVGAEEHTFTMAETLRDARLPVNLLAEPVGRNTAAAAAAVALEAAAHWPDHLVLLAPSDHRIADTEAFYGAVATGGTLAADGRLVVFGITPDGPETRYGYIQANGTEVERFVEKPEPELAERLVAEGCTWNAGLFLFDPEVMLQAFETHAPEVLAGSRRAWNGSDRDGGCVHLGATWRDVPAAPLDKAIMERTSRASVVPAAMGWTDLGTYDALFEVAHEGSNATIGDVVHESTTGSYLHADGVLLAVQDVHDLIVVSTPDATLVAPRSSASDLKRVVQRLQDRKEVREHRSSHRPWGDYRVVDAGPGFQIKRLTVAAGQSLSLQRHSQREEHWIVTVGEGLLTLGDEEHSVRAGHHVRIPAGLAHRIANTGKGALVLVEVQIGAYLGEDDIERLEDRYGRT